MPQAIMLEVEPLFAVWTCNPLILVFIAMAEVARGCWRKIFVEEVPIVAGV
jgi:hypothetical protein